jgi:hypothetical protein
MAFEFNGIFSQQYVSLLAFIDFFQQGFMAVLDLPAHDIESLGKLCNFVMFGQ